MLPIATLQALGNAVAAPPEKRGPRLAVIVEAESNSAIDADILQALVEKELFENWQGVLLERTQIKTILDELKLSKQNPGGRRPLQMGKLLNVDYLLYARANDKVIRVSIDKFPAGAVLNEARFEASLGAEALARQSAITAIRSIEQDTLDASTIYVSIGSMIYADPFRRYEKFDETIHDMLREHLSKQPGVVVNERRFVSYLLREFELARSGVAQHTVTNLSAPASDLLIVADFRLAALQPVGQAKATLEFTVRILSPTGLAISRQLQFTALGDDTQHVVSAIEKGILPVLKDIRASGRIARRHQANLDEYSALKKQAFSLLPSQPQEDGNFYHRNSYRGPGQVGSRAEMFRALASLENAMLFRGDDPQVLLATAAVLEGIVDLEAYSIERLPPERQKRIRDIMNAALDYIESAYVLSPDDNARGFYHHAISRGFRHVLPARTQRMARRMVDTAKAGNWHDHEVHESLRYLFGSLESFDEKSQLFLKLERQWRQEGHVNLRLIFDLAEAMQTHLLKHKEDLRLMVQGAAFADKLIASESPTIQGFGHWIRVTIYYFGESQNPQFVPHIRKLVDLIPAMHREYPDQFAGCSLQFRTLDWLREYEDFAKRKNLPDDVTDQYYRYVVNQLSIKHYSAHLMPCFQRILPALEKKGDFADGYRLLTEYLEHYTAGGSADLDRMLLARWRNRFSRQLAKRKDLQLTQLSGVKLVSRDGSVGQAVKSNRAWDGPAHVTRLVYAFDRVWVVLTDQYRQYRLGQIFSFVPGAAEAQQVQTVDGVVTDLAASDNEIAVSTVNDGLWLLNKNGAKIAHYTAANSPLPGNIVCAVCSRDSAFLFAVAGKDGLWHMYNLEPRKGEIHDLNLALSYHSYYRIAPGAAPKEEAVVTESWSQRSWWDGTQRLKFRVEPVKHAVNKAVVVDAQGKTLFEYTGFELNYVYDFAVWGEHLVFASGNGLYICKPGSTRLRCILDELDLEAYALYPIDSRLFVGTNKGVFVLDAETFQSIVGTDE